MTRGKVEAVRDRPTGPKAATKTKTAGGEPRKSSRIDGEVARQEAGYVEGRCWRLLVDGRILLSYILREAVMELVGSFGLGAKRTRTKGSGISCWDAVRKLVLNVC